jgi:hypothetical protein
VVKFLVGVEVGSFEEHLVGLLRELILVV